MSGTSSPEPPLLVAIVGGIVGGGITILGRYILEKVFRRSERFRQEHLLADALRGELFSIRDQIKLFRYIGCEASNLIENKKKSTDEVEKQIRDEFSLFKEIKMPVFNANVERIGYLKTKLSRRIVRFYEETDGLNILAKRIIIVSEEEMTFRIKWFSKECRSLEKEANYLADKLMEFIKFKNFKMPRGYRRSFTKEFTAKMRRKYG